MIFATEAVSSDMLSWVTGPVGAVALSAIILWWVGTGAKALVGWLGGRLDKWVDRGFGQVDEMIKQGKRDREFYEDSATKDREIYQTESTLDREMHQKYMGELVTEFKEQGRAHREVMRTHEQKLDQILDHVRNG